ncbi:MAG: nitrile hydratase accessory protein [Pseudomonadota bacterium]
MTDPAPPFDTPWQAQLFGITVALQEKGAFSAAQWADALGAELAGETRSGNDAYWKAWLRAFEAILAKAKLANATEIADLTRAWQAAARATPHGQPIEL